MGKQLKVEEINTSSGFVSCCNAVFISTQVQGHSFDSHRGELYCNFIVMVGHFALPLENAILR